MTSESVTIYNRNDFRMRLHIEQSAQAAKDTVILHHGYSGSSKSPALVRLKDIFLACGFRTVMVDGTNSIGNGADGDVADFQFGVHADDLEDAFEWVRARAWGQGALHAVGYSLGGFSATRLAARFNGHVSSLVLMAPVFSGAFFRERLEAGFPGIYKVWEADGAMFLTSDQGATFDAPFSGWKEWLKADALEPALREYAGRVRVITAGEDTLVQPSHLEAARRAFARADFGVVSLEGENHFFNQKPRSLEDAASRFMPL